jgi:hypothetical protein
MQEIFYGDLFLEAYRSALIEVTEMDLDGCIIFGEAYRIYRIKQGDTPAQARKVVSPWLDTRHRSILKLIESAESLRDLDALANTMYKIHTYMG